MAVDLHSPLGVEPSFRKDSRRKRFSSSVVLNFFVWSFLSGFSVYTAFSGYIRDTGVILNYDQLSSNKTSSPLSIRDSNIKSLQDFSKPQEDINQMGSDKRSILSKIIDHSTNSSGLSPSHVDQQQYFPAVPNENLMEDSVYGRLPIRGMDGKSPAKYYARSLSNTKGVRIAIVVSGLGISQTGTQYAISQLPENITLAFASGGNSLQRWGQEARKAGHEILLQVPMEAFDSSNKDYNLYTLTVNQSVQQLVDRLHQSLARMNSYVGVMNYLGGRFLSNPQSVQILFNELSKRGLLFFDDGTSLPAVTKKFAPLTKLPYLVADLYLDNHVDRVSILKNLDDLEKIARQKGTAIGVAVAFNESVDIITKWVEESYNRDISVVPLSNLADLTN
ncbi:putative polysaccharide deacetylase [Liberibacter crescens BT-1]|uniref:Putative polysaccharide deacetylase n=1 Tax=Liberibacter crescens (strain BT-1) TaxID=1215343 RepID=L0ETN9_LIBCB|nr:divergent polysaccharide deacetylase family protein [Liberibacter crescens]AGA64332.1 putative polysaccharide deacetylase [Liberibacter crescens BT-1]AMC12537.1 hypothetical protein RL73_01860 [Liberibacter crescens]